MSTIHNALFLYSEVMPYTIEGLKALINISGINIYLIHYSLSEKAPYKLPPIKGLIYYNNNDFNESEIKSLIKSLNPKFIFVSGWGNPKYLKVSLFAKKEKIPVISGCDTPWRSDFRQMIAVLFSKVLIRRYFDFLMVAGKYQFEYARLLGFKRNRILYPLYSANVSLFFEKSQKCLISKQLKFPRNILFVGRFEKEKGINLLVNAFNLIPDKKGWTLTLIGNGSLKESIKEQTKNNSEIIIKGFLQPEKLAVEIETAGAFCLPSVYEPWGVVLHEFAAAGLPIICSDACGASTEFVKEKFNGFVFQNKNMEQLKIKIEDLINLSDKELLEYSKRSSILAQKITPEIYASNFHQFL